MAGLDLAELKKAADAFHLLEGDGLLRYQRAQVQAMANLEELAAMNDMDRAATAYFLARTMKSLLMVHTVEISDVIVNTATGYTLAAAQLVGLLEPVDG
jgi:hypothetical protein